MRTILQVQVREQPGGRHQLSCRVCSGRCGDQLRAPFTCACDELCAQFSDCCEDYARACAPQQIPALHAAHTSTLFTCLGSDTLLRTVVHCRLSSVLSSGLRVSMSLS